MAALDAERYLENNATMIGVNHYKKVEDYHDYEELS
jgi:hypothetical protein